MTKAARRAILAANAARAREAKAVKRASTNGHLHLTLERTEGRFLHDVLDGMGHESAVKIRRALLDQAFSSGSATAPV